MFKIDRLAAPGLRYAAVVALAMLGAVAHAESILIASTTSTEQSGLFGHMLPAFKQATGIDVKVVAVGTGQAIDIARRGDADVLFVHNRAAEEKFVAEGFSAKRHPVMYNDFVLIGPKADPAGVRGKDIALALKKLAATNATFIARGDGSGTDAAEHRFWSLTDEPGNHGRGYRACGCGMGPALSMASAIDAYVLSDRGTWLKYKNRGELSILVEGDVRMFNQYGVMAVNPARYPHVKAAAAQQFVDWVISPAGQAVIANYKINGEQLFFPDANAADR